jgi:hypothetical protein
VALLASFNDVSPLSDDFALAWARSKDKKEAAEGARRLGILVEL